MQKCIYPILYLKGDKDTKELLRLLPEYINLSEDDLIRYKGRSDFKYTQTLRNIVSHQTDWISDYDYGYRIRKNAGRSSNAEFSLRMGLVVKHSIDGEWNRSMDYERMNAKELPHITCDYPDVVAKVSEFERLRVKSFAGNQDMRVYDIVNDFPKIAAEAPWHILSIDANGYPISIYVEKCMGKPNPDILSDGALSFVQSRHLKNASYIYFVNDKEEISIISTQECRRDV